jgi:hypothetical protein
VRLQPLGFPAVALHLDQPDALVLVPQSGTAAVDVSFARFAPDNFSREIEIDKLSLVQVIDQQTTAVTLVRKESTVLAGEVRVPAAGRRVHLKQGEGLRFDTLTGSLIDLRLTADGIHAGFQGRVSKLERVSPGLPPESLMPTVLDPWIAPPARATVLGAASGLAVVILFLTALDGRLRPRLRRAPSRSPLHF